MASVLMFQCLLERCRLSLAWQEKVLLQLPCSESKGSARSQYIIDVVVPDWNIDVVVDVQMLGSIRSGGASYAVGIGEGAVGVGGVEPSMVKSYSPAWPSGQDHYAISLTRRHG